MYIQTGNICDSPLCFFFYWIIWIFRQSHLLYFFKSGTVTRSMRERPRSSATLPWVPASTMTWQRRPLSWRCPSISIRRAPRWRVWRRKKRKNRAAGDWRRKLNRHLQKCIMKKLHQQVLSGTKTRLYISQSCFDNLDHFGNITFDLLWRQ